MFVGDLVKEKAQGKNDGARDDPIGVGPKYSRLIEERAKGRPRNQQPDSIENREHADVNERQIARPAAKEEKCDRGESDSEKSDGGRNNRELPAQLRARKRCHGLGQGKRAGVRRVGHVGLNCIQVHRLLPLGPSRFGPVRGAIVGRRLRRNVTASRRCHFHGWFENNAPSRCVLIERIAPEILPANASFV